MCNYHNFRDHTPNRRENIKFHNNYKNYRPFLKEDFQNKCWYCNDRAFQFRENFQIDHFIPQKPPRNVTNLGTRTVNNDYSNLVFSCPLCNNAKSNKRPTWRIDLPHDGERGFIDPTSIEYENLFLRDPHWNIIPNNNYQHNRIAQYIYEELRLWLPIHSYYWKLNILDETITRLESVNVQDSEIQNQINWLLVEFAHFFRTYFI